MAKSKSEKNSVLMKIGLIALVLGVMLIWMNKDDMRAVFFAPVDIYEEDYDAKELKAGMGVDAEIYCVLDTFGTLETTRTSNGAVTGKSYKYYYIVPIFDDYDTYWIAVEVASSDKNIFEKIADETWAYLTGSTTSFGKTTYDYSGIVEKLDSKAYKYMREWFEEAEWFEDDEDIDEYVWPLVLKIRSRSAVRVLAIAGFVLLFAAILFLVLYFKSGKTKTKTVSDTPAGKLMNYDGYVVINSTKYVKSDFEVVDNLIKSGNIEDAVTAVRDRTGLDSDTAADIVNNWKKYYI